MSHLEWGTIDWIYNLFLKFGENLSQIFHVMTNDFTLSYLLYIKDITYIFSTKTNLRKNNTFWTQHDSDGHEPVTTFVYNSVVIFDISKTIIYWHFFLIDVRGKKRPQVVCLWKRLRHALSYLLHLTRPFFKL